MKFLVFYSSGPHPSGTPLFLCIGPSSLRALTLRGSTVREKRMKEKKTGKGKKRKKKKKETKKIREKKRKSGKRDIDGKKRTKEGKIYDAKDESSWHCEC